MQDEAMTFFLWRSSQSVRYLATVSSLVDGSIIGFVVLTCSINRAMLVAFSAVYVCFIQYNIISLPAANPDQCEVGVKLE
jgi:hypothetical protein